MTDTYVEEQLLERFKEIGTPFLKYTEDGEIQNVLFENESFERPADGNWFEFFFIPPEPFQKELFRGARNRYSGIVQINICVPNNVGTASSKARYNAIAEHFRRGDIVNGVKIAKTYRSPAFRDGDYYVTPVTIEWEADLDN